MNAKEQILARVRQANAAAPDTPYEAIPRAYTASWADLDREAVFTERLVDYNAQVHACDPDAVAETIARVLRARGKSGVLVPDAFPAAWLPEGFTFSPDRGQLSYEELDRSEGVLTGCAAAIAMTGTIVLHHRPENGRRALTLIPDYHLCVVRSSQIEATVPEGMRRIARLTEPQLLTTISGPSATSDIEMTRVKGVHGPRTLEVILVRHA